MPVDSVPKRNAPTLQDQFKSEALLKDQKGVVAPKAQAARTGIAETVRGDSVGFETAQDRTAVVAGETPASVESSGTAEAQMLALAEKVENGPPPTAGVKASAQGEVQVSSAAPPIGAALSFMTAALRDAKLTPAQLKQVTDTIGMTNGLGTEAAAQNGARLVPAALAAVVAANMNPQAPPAKKGEFPRGGHGKVVSGGNAAGPAPGTINAPPTSVVNAVPSGDDTLDQPPPYEADNAQAGQIASGQIVIPDQAVMQMEQAAQPMVMNITGMDIDMAVEMILEQAGNSSDLDLQGMVTQMQQKLQEKNAQRAKIAQLQSAQSSITAELTQRFLTMSAEGEVPTGMTQDQFNAQVKVAWGDGMTKPDGTYVGPTPTIIEPIVLTDPRAPAASNAGSGAAYGITDNQMAMLTAIYGKSPYAPSGTPVPPQYATFAEFMSNVVGINPVKQPQDMITNLGKVATFVAGLAPGVAPTTVDAATSTANLSQLQKDLTSLAEVTTLLNANIIPTGSPQTLASLQAQQTQLQQTVAGDLAKPLDAADAATLSAWQTGSGSNTLFATMQTMIAGLKTTVGAALSEYEAQLKKASSDSKGHDDPNDYTHYDNYVGTEGFGLTGAGYYGKIRDTGDNGDSWGHNLAVTGSPVSGSEDGDGYSVTMPGAPDNTNPLLATLMAALSGSSEQIPIADMNDAGLDAFANKLGSGAAGAVLVMATQCGLPKSSIAALPGDTQPILQADLDSYKALEAGLDPNQFAGITFNSDGTWSGDDSQLDPTLKAALEADFKNTPTAAQQSAQAAQNAAYQSQYGTGQSGDPAMQFNHTGTIGDLGAALSSAQSDMDSLNDMSEMQQMRLQSAMSQRETMYSTLSNVMKKVSDTQDGIVNNLK